jgi:hypothetical protein
MAGSDATTRDVSSSDEERAGLLSREGPDVSSGLKVGEAFKIALACLAYIVLSASLINYNKFLMHADYFPYSIALTAWHMCVSSGMSLLVYACFGKSLLPGMAYVEEDKAGFVKKVIPLSLCFAISICLSNEAYLYCSVPFLQMCKELNVVMVYFVGLALAVERFSVQTATVLLIIMMGCCMSIHGEMKFSKAGFMFQLCAQFAEVIKIIIQQKIMQGFKIDPLTMVLIMSPLCLVSLSVGLVVFWEPGIIAHAEEHAFHLVLNGFNAFALNVAVAVVIRFASGVSFVLAGVVKDVAIVACAALLFGALITPIQIIGFSIAVAGVMFHSVMRSNQDLAMKHGAIRTVSSVIFGCPKLEEKYGKAERSA